MRKQIHSANGHPTKAARWVSIVLFVLSAVFITVGVYGWLMGDWNLQSLRPISAQVYEAPARGPFVGTAH